MFEGRRRSWWRNDGALGFYPGMRGGFGHWLLLLLLLRPSF
jgi:hypothetical protein